MYDSVIITDPNGYVIEVNPGAVSAFGHEIEDILDKPISLMIPRLTQDVLQRIGKALAADRHVKINAFGVCKGGAKIGCHITVWVIDMVHPGDLVFTIHSIEGERVALHSLHVRANAFQMAPVPLFGCDEKGRFVEVNGAFCEMFDLAGEDAALSHEFADFLSDGPLLENFRKALAGEKTSVRIVAEDDGGASQGVEVSLAPNVRGRKITGVVGCLQKV